MVLPALKLMNAKMVRFGVSTVSVVSAQKLVFGMVRIAQASLLAKVVKFIT